MLSLFSVTSVGVTRDTCVCVCVCMHVFVFLKGRLCAHAYAVFLFRAQFSPVILKYSRRSTSVLMGL